MDPYTAYENRSPAATTMDIAMTPFKPSTHLWAYGTVPGMWSGTKGLYVPFNTRASKEALRGVGGVFKQGDYLAGLGKVFKGTVGSVRPFGVGGSRILPFGETLNKYNKKIGILRTQQTTKWNRYMDMLTKEDSFMAEQQKIITQARNKLATPTGTKRWRQGKFKLRKSVKIKQTATIDAAEAAMAKYGRTLKSMESSMQRGKTLINKMAARRGALSAGKWALRAGKAVSIVGAAMLAVDLTRMVGEPLGRAVVSEVDQALTSYEDRFMPEVGGRLEMTYLSRGAATDRQRAINAMSKAQITGRSAFGQEARYAHQ